MNFDNIVSGELVEIWDEGNIKLVPPNEKSSNDIETIHLAPKLHRVISSKITAERNNELKVESDKRGPDHEINSAKREDNLSIEVVEQTQISYKDAQEAKNQQPSSSLESTTTLLGQATKYNKQEEKEVTLNHILMIMQVSCLCM